MNTQSNVYTVVYSAIMVVVVAAALTLVSVGLKDRQNANMENEKRVNILKAAGVIKTVDAEGNKIAVPDANAVASMYNEHVKESFVVDSLGNKTNKDAFQNLDSAVFKSVYKNGKFEKVINLPIFVVENNGSNLYVVPLAGNGLWDKIWGYAALQTDFSTIAGTVFDHKGETPGLGAEMVKPFFQAQFVGRQMFDGDNFVALSVYKGDPKKNDCQDKLHGIDAISGSTMTTNGVQKMVNDCLKAYAPYRAKLGQTPAIEEAPIMEAPVADSTAAPAADSTNVTK